MKKLLQTASAAALLAASFAQATDLNTAPATAPVAANPITQPWKGPYGGVPAWDKVKVEDFKAAI
jgi:peptidyl-dipeptidase Dcp